MSWKNYFKAITLSPRFHFGGLLFCLLVLFLPQRIMNVLGLAEMREEYRWVFGISFLFSAVFFAVQMIPTIRKKMFSNEIVAHAFQELEGLSAYETHILSECLTANTRTINLESDSPPARSLADKGLLEMVEGVGDPISWPWTIPLHVWEHLKKHPEKVGCRLR